jgi:glucoamylase
VSLNYLSSIGDGSWEYWGADVPIFVDGITKLLNVTYQATDIGKTYSQVLNRPVKASGAPEPTLPAPPAPYASPSGFGDDITNFLAVSVGSEAETAFARMFLNINPAIAEDYPGTVVAARSGPSYSQKIPDYGRCLELELML